MPTLISGSTGVNKITDGTIVDADVTDVAASKLTGTIADARFPSTLPAASAANLTAIPAANITGTLPAISGANLTSVRDTTGGRRNIIINGAMQVAQRGTSSTSTGYQTVDRFNASGAGLDEAFTQSQHALTSSDTEVWAKGFRYSHHITNGNQTSGAGAADRVLIYQLIEAQDIANSGWDYTSASSYITLSFWVKSSVAQNFYGRVNPVATTAQNYAFETGSLTADTWTKITKTIPGNSNIVMPNNNTHGLTVEIIAFRGTDKTGSMSLNTWAAFDTAVRVPDMTTTWFTTNDATFEITGVQLELGSVATDFEHRSYGEELALCQRYFEIYGDGKVSDYALMAIGANWTTTNSRAFLQWQVEKRAAPTVTEAGTWYIRNHEGSSGGVSTKQFDNPSKEGTSLVITAASAVLVAGNTAMIWLQGSASATQGDRGVYVDAEL
jgi:hypothetical protein